MEETIEQKATRRFFPRGTQVGRKQGRLTWAQARNIMWPTRFDRCISWPHARHDAESKMARSAENGPVHPNRNCELTAFDKYVLGRDFQMMHEVSMLIMASHGNACWGRCHLGGLQFVSGSTFVFPTCNTSRGATC